MNLTTEQKKSECLRICGENPRFHRFAPERCPFKDDEWKHPKRKNEYSAEIK
jgi:hypothetical protein